MTGEIFNLLSSKSILAASVEADDLSPQMYEAFIKGVKETIDSNILNALFHVRTNLLFGVSGKKENYHYLNGLLLGGELKAVSSGNYTIVTIVSTGNLIALYTKALAALDFKGKLLHQDADAALISGQTIILININKKNR